MWPLMTSVINSARSMPGISAPAPRITRIIGNHRALSVNVRTLRMWRNANIFPYIMPKTYDIAVLGGTAAGYVAAEALAKKGHSVIALSSSETAGDTESPLGDWIPAEILTACPTLRKVKTAATDSPFRAVHFHSADLADHAVYRSRSAAGFVLRPEKFLKTLAK
ncbi:MAG: hypothetical protein K8R91_00925, partial [Phycisphaerae bacterium]|nr:hypothetical protein [Phycisphaerae bacterium]